MLTCVLLVCRISDHGVMPKIPTDMLLVCRISNHGVMPEIPTDVFMASL